MSFSFGSMKTATTTAASTFGTTTPATDKKSVFGGFSNLGAQAQATPFGSTGVSSAAPSSLFSTPVTSNPTQAPLGFGKPLSFGSGAPPNITVGSPAFGQPQAQASPFGMTSQQAAPPAFGTPQTTEPPKSLFGSGQGASSFGQPPAPTATPGFGFSTPASGFSTAQPAAPAATSANLSTPAGFGLSFGSKPTVSFGAPAGNTAAPSFGTPAQPAQPVNTSFGADKPSLFGNQPSQATGGFSFDTPAATAAPTAQTTGLNFGQPTAQPTQPTAQPSQLTAQPTGLNFAATSQPSLFGQPSQTMFGGPAAPESAKGLFGSATPQPTGLNFNATSTPASTGVTKPAQTPGLFGAASVSAAPASAPSTAPVSAPAASAATSQPTATGFGAPLSFASKPGGLSFGTPASTAVPTTGLSFGTPSTAASGGLSFSAAATSAAPAPAGFTAATSAATGLNFTAATSTGLNFGAKLPTSSAAPTSSAPSGITALGKTATTTMPTMIPTTSTKVAPTPLVPPQEIVELKFSELEENINKWTLDLEEQEKTFINQATQINAWDRLLINNGEKIVELNEVVQAVKNEQQSLEHELDFVLAQQKDLEDLLAPMEKNLSENVGDRVRDPEREQMYTLAESLDSQLKQMSEDLKEVIEHLNETNRGQDSNDPIVQIGRILNTHMSSMQWIDNSIAQITNKLDQLRATHDTLRRDNEISFQKTYDKL